MLLHLSGVGGILHGEIDHGVLDNGVLNTGLAELGAQRGILLHGQTTEVNQNDGLRLFKLFFDGGNDRLLAFDILGKFVLGHLLNTSHSVL